MDKNFFLNPQNAMQKRYETLRAIFVDNLSAEEIAKKFDYSIHTVYYLKKKCMDKSFQDFFLPLHNGAYTHHSKTVNAESVIINLRKQNFLIIEIQEQLAKQNIILSLQTINAILEREGFAKLYRRTKAERFLILSSQRNKSEKSSVKRFGERQNFSTPFGGLFLFIPILQKLNADKLIDKINLYGSKDIPKINYFMKNENRLDYPLYLDFHFKKQHKTAITL